jgi:hypothetical protein
MDGPESREKVRLKKKPDSNLNKDFEITFARKRDAPGTVLAVTILRLLLEGGRLDSKLWAAITNIIASLCLSLSYFPQPFFIAPPTLYPSFSLLDNIPLFLGNLLNLLAWTLFQG